MRSRLAAVVAGALFLTLGACSGDEGEGLVESGSPQQSASAEPTAGSTGTAEARSGAFTVSIPEGWVSEETNETSELYLRSEAEAGVEIGVASSPIASADGLTEYVEGQREQVGQYTNVTEVTDASPLEYPVGNDPATTFDWFFTADLDNEETDLVERRVIFVHSGRLYDVTLQSPVETSEGAFTALDQVLGSLAFTAG